MEWRTKVLKFHDDEATEYAILSHRQIDPMEVDYKEMVVLAKMDREEQDEICDRLGYKKIVDTCKQAKPDGMSGCGSTLAALTSEAAPSCLKRAIRCIGGMQTRRCVKRTSMTLMAPPFPLKKTEKYHKSNG